MKPIIISIMLLPCLAFGQTRLNLEQYYTDQWCLDKGGNTKVTLPDDTRPDCVTYAHAIETDFADKWAEAIGQSLHYARMLDLPPAILFIIEKPSDQRYLERVDMILRRYNLDIAIFTTGPVSTLPRIVQ